MSKKLLIFISLVLIAAVMLTGCDMLSEILAGLPFADDSVPSVSLDSIPDFDGKNPYVIINENVPFFESESTSDSYEHFSELDVLGRCGAATACIGIDLMPSEDRGSIGQVKPSGWHTVKYDVVDGKYLYNRCHLIGFQLTGENANTKNLITGTRYMNVIGMLPFENQVADYVKENPQNHVLYRVTPIYDGNNLVANGVLMEAKSVEDNGADILFCVYVYNAQPGIVIDYANGSSRLSTDPPSQDTGNEDDNACESHADTSGDGICENCNKTAESAEENDYVLNTKTQKFHKPECRHAKSMSETNKALYTGIREDLILEGYDPCGTCKP